MKKRLKKGVTALAVALAVFLPFVSAIPSANAETAELKLAATSRAALLMDCDTGAVIFEKNVSDHLPIASMVKIMTLGLCFDEIEKREIPLDTMVTASENAASMGGSQAFLDANADYRLDELLKSIVVASANDSCVAVAEYLYGSVDAFVAEMNNRAAEWGMTDTSFVNCTGLPKDGQYCCAKDVAVMFKKLIKHEKFFEYAGVWMYDFEHPDGRVTGLTNTNKLIKFYDGCDGGKTGYTDAARSCITVTAKRGDTRLVCVTIGAENSKTRNKEVSEMLNYGFSNYKTIRAVKCGDVMGNYDVTGGKTDCISVGAADDFSLFVKSGDKCDIELKPVIDGLKAPISAGDVVGKIIIEVNGEERGSVDAIALDGCEKKGYTQILEEFFENW